MKKSTAFWMLLALPFFSSLNVPRAEPIYGDDDREDVYAADASLQELASSTVLLTKKEYLVDSGHGGYNAKGVHYTGVGTSEVAGAPGDSGELPLKPDTRFYNQVETGFCSGALIAPDLILTAGHCLKDARPQEIAAVFDFSMAGQEKLKSYPFPRANVYMGLKSISINDAYADWGILQLDRPVAGRKTLKLGLEGSLQPGMDVLTIGHPDALPTKIAGPAAVTDIGRWTFGANLDIFHGNSGGAVFDARTREIVGIAVTEPAPGRDYQPSADGKTAAIIRWPKNHGNVPEAHPRVERIEVVLPYLAKYFPEQYASMASGSREPAKD